MIKHLFSFVVICLIACGSVVPTTALKKDIKNITNGEDKILWSSNRKLTWNDFKGKNKGIFDSRKAETATVIETVKTYYDLEGIPVYEIACYFIPIKSWSNTSEEFALCHEQLHFDIGELYTRKIRKSYDSLNAKKIKKFKTYENIFYDLDNKCKNYNNLYDSQVYNIKEDNSVDFNKQQQQVWIEKVAEELEKLKQYEYKPSLPHESFRVVIKKSNEFDKNKELYFKFKKEVR